jgi:hypothetical protein
MQHDAASGLSQGGIGGSVGEPMGFDSFFEEHRSKVFGAM